MTSMAPVVGALEVAEALDLDATKAAVLAAELRNALCPVTCVAGELADETQAEMLRLSVQRLERLAMAVRSRARSRARQSKEG